ncbi:MAG: hypothetical protein IJA89_02610 [Clostridia bacterium]|nr:hypothetical protein [Clostridia bacterium]
MIGFDKKTIKAKQRRKIKTFSSFDIDYRAFASEKAGESALVGAWSRNCRIVDGVLTTGEDLTVYRPDDEVMAIAGTMPTTDVFFDMYTKDSDGTYARTLGILYETGMARTYKKSIGTWAIMNNFGSRMKTLQCFGAGGVPNQAFVGTPGVFTCTGLTLEKAEGVETALPIACAFKDRLFCAINPFTVAFSAALEPTDFLPSIDNGGQITFASDKGEIVALLGFCDGVYIFYERGISRLDVAGKARDMKLERLEYDGGRIFGETVAVCSGKEEKAFFLAESGLYAFDGKSARSVCENLQIRPTRTGQICKSAAAEHTYSVQYVDRTGKKRRVVIDAERETGYDSFITEGLSVVQGRFTCRYEGEPYTVSADSAAGVLPENEAYSFTTYDLDFGVSGEKRLQSVEFFGDGEITVTVSSERTTKTCKLTFVDGKASARLWLKGKRFSFSFALEKGAKLQAMSAELLYE